MQLSINNSRNSPVITIEYYTLKPHDSLVFLIAQSPIPTILEWKCKMTEEHPEEGRNLCLHCYG